MGNICRVLAIQGSYRKSGKTTTMLKYAAKQAEKLGHSLTYINLFEKNIEYCRGCRKCLETGECVFKNDDMPEITRPFIPSQPAAAFSPRQISSR